MHRSTGIASLRKWAASRRKSRTMVIRPCLAPSRDPLPTRFSTSTTNFALAFSKRSTATLANELADRGIQFKREPLIEVVCRGRVVGKYRPDFLVESCLVVEAKSTRVIGEADSRQLLNCLKATEYQVGYLLHFGP